MLSIYALGNSRIMVVKGLRKFKTGIFYSGFLERLDRGYGYDTMTEAQEALDKRADKNGWKWCGSQKVEAISEYKICRGKAVLK
jgi:hypothetical protein